MRVIGEDGAQLGVLSIDEAIRLAMTANLDLVEVSPNSDPPVCRVMDFGKYKYQLQKKQQEARKKQTIVQIKEIKFRPKTDDHDFDTKVKHVRRFLEGGDRCKVTIFFRGREVVHKERGEDILLRVVAEVADISKVEQAPQFEGRTMNVLLSPVAKKVPK